MIKVSVIIPIYNTERHLRRCLDSVLAQTLKEIEIICVDDGSTDSSPDILQEYTEKDKRIRLIHKENGGVVSARNAGIKIAAGNYIGFMDSDDWIEPEMYERLYLYGIENHTELVSSGYFMEGNYTTVHYDDVPPGLYDEKSLDFLRENTIYNTETKEAGIRGSLCCKLFLAEPLKRVHAQIPDGLSMSEDKMCVLSYLLESRRVYIAKEAFYHYMIHPNSAVHTPNSRYLEAVNGVYQYAIQLYAHPAFTKAMRMQMELYIIEMLYKGINSRMGFENRNLFWIDPYWLRDIPGGARVALYGGGELGDVYRRQLESRGDLSFAGCMDFGWKKLREDDRTILSPEELTPEEFDMLVITIKNSSKAHEVKEQLIEAGIPEHKIRWFEQKEIYWKFAEANGWLKGKTDTGSGAL